MLTFFAKLAAGHFRRHRLEGVLCLTGIVLGVAVVIAIDAAVLACVGSFRGAVDSLAERSTHSIFAQQGSISDEDYIALRNGGFAWPIAPVIDRGALISSASSDRPVGEASITGRLIGVDAFSERSLRSFTQMQSSLDKTAFRRFLTDPDQVVLVDTLADRLGAKVGDDVVVTLGAHRRIAHVAAVVALSGVARSQLTDLIIADLATAQELADAVGKLDRIDLHLDNSAEADEVTAALPKGLTLRSTRQRADSLAELIASYKLNLNALSLMASFVAVFIVYNSLLISVRQRLVSLGILRCLGASRCHLAGVYLLEALVLSILGGVLGVLAGWGLSRQLVGAVATTINDLYASVRPALPTLDAAAFAKGIALSTVSAMAGAIIPLWQAARTPPVGAFQSTAGAQGSRTAATRLLIAGLVLLGAAVLACVLPGSSPVVGFVVALLVALGFAFACPALTRIICRIAEQIARPMQALPIQMAAAGVERSLGITGVAVAAMMLAMAMNVGVRTMVSSFRGALSSWVNQRFAADVFVAPELLVNHKVEATLDPQAVEWVRNRPEVSRVVANRVTSIVIENKSVMLTATDVAELLRSRSLPIKQIRDGDFNAEREAMISEPLAGRLKLKPGDTLKLDTPSGERVFTVFGIFYDFGSERGQVVLDRGTYAKAYHDESVTSLHVTLQPGTKPEVVAAAWGEALRATYPVVVSSFGQVKTEVMTVFDRTFRVTEVLSWLAGGVAFCGLAGSLLALALARRRDYGVLLAVGMSGRQTAEWLLAQGLILAWVSAAVAAVAGTVLAYVLSNVIQFRSFGWSIPTTPQPRFWIEGFVLATLAAIVAAIYPIYRLRSMPPAGALRQE